MYIIFLDNILLFADNLLVLTHNYTIMEHNLGINIRKVREIKNIGQSYMADKLGISQSQYSDIENGKVKIKEPKLIQIASILDVSPEVIKNFNEQFIFNSCVQSGYIQHQTINPIEKIHELYEKLIIEKDAQISILKENIAFLRTLTGHKS